MSFSCKWDFCFHSSPSRPALEHHFLTHHLPVCIPEYMAVHQRRIVDGRVELYEDDLRLSQVLAGAGDITTTTITTTTGISDSFPLPPSFEPPPSSGLSDHLTRHPFLPDPTEATDFTDFLRFPSPGPSPDLAPASSQLLPSQLPQPGHRPPPPPFSHASPSSSRPSQPSQLSFPSPVDSQYQPMTQPPPPSFRGIYPSLPDQAITPSSTTFSAKPLRFGAALETPGSTPSSPTQNRTEADTHAHDPDTGSDSDRIEQQRPLSAGVGFAWGTNLWK